MNRAHSSGRRAFLPAVFLILASPFVAADDVSDAAGHRLAGEVALNEQDYRTAAVEFRKAAEISNRVEDARQATEIGFVYGFNDEALASAKRWLGSE